MRVVRSNTSERRAVSKLTQVRTSPRPHSKAKPWFLCNLQGRASDRNNSGLFWRVLLPKRGHRDPAKQIRRYQGQAWFSAPPRRQWCGAKRVQRANLDLLLHRGFSRNNQSSQRRGHTLLQDLHVQKSSTVSNCCQYQRERLFLMILADVEVDHCPTLRTRILKCIRKNGLCDCCIHNQRVTWDWKFSAEIFQSSIHVLYSVENYERPINFQTVTQRFNIPTHFIYR